MSLPINSVNVALFIAMSIMYQLYIYGFTDDGEINGGEVSRAIAKIVVFFLFILEFHRISKLHNAFSNLTLKLPLFFYLINLMALAVFLEGAHKQALNIFFFMPFIFVNWRSSIGRDAYRNILKFISFLVLIQTFVDPFAKVVTGIWWENRALVGGLGNPSVMGLFLLVAGLYFQFFLNRFSSVMASLCFLLTFFTGAALPTILGCYFLFILLIRNIIKYRVYAVFFLCLFLPVVIYFSLDLADYVLDSNAISHSMGKMFALFSLFSANAGGESLSVSGRLDYGLAGLELLGEYPLAILFGHPNFMIMYNGDGHYTAFLVTFGLPFLIFFVFANLYLIFKFINSKDDLDKFSAIIIIVYLAFFSVNRILDYWPAALVYILAFSYLCGVRHSDSSVK